MSKNLFCKWHFCYLVGPYVPTPTPCHQPLTPPREEPSLTELNSKRVFAAPRFEILFKSTS